MTEGQWEKMQRELKQIAPDRAEGPVDAERFKQNVLREYRKRTQTEARSRWLGRAATGLAAAAAVWVSFLLTGPDAPHSLDGTEQAQAPNGVEQPLAGSAQTAAELEQQAKLLAPDGVVQQFYDMLLQKRNEDAKVYLSADLRKKSGLIASNLSNPHMIGFTIEPREKSGSIPTFQVKLRWGNYLAVATMETYQVRLKKEDGRWVIDAVEQVRQSTFEGTDRMAHRVDDDITEVMKRSELPGTSSWAFFTINPQNEDEMVFALQERAPEIYRVHAQGRTKDVRKLTTLPAGEVGEIFWSEEGVLALNFTPEGTKHDVILFYDANTGEPLNWNWVAESLQDVGASNPHIVHDLPDGKFRIRSDALSAILDSQNRRFSPDPNGLQPLHQVKFEKTVDPQKLGSSALAFYFPTSAPEELNKIEVPKEKRLNLLEETGLYVVNGSVQSISFAEHELQVELSKEPGKVQVLAVPYSILKPYAGKRLHVRVFDETGKVLADTDDVVVP